MKRASALFALLLLLLVSQEDAYSQSVFPLRKDLVWSKPDQEIVSAAFSPDGTLVALVTQVRWPDGHEAEGLPESFFTRLEERKKANPRFADPVIKLVSLTGEVVCEAQYGWSPSVSPDNHRIAFSEQVKPITGLRVLAETRAGNAIRVFDCATKQTAKLVEANEGYLDQPLFTADGKAIVFTINEAVNGAYGGSVGIGLFDAEQNRKSELLAKHTSFLRGFPRLVFRIAAAANEVAAMVATPTGLAGTYMAANYDIDLISVFPKQRKILALGEMGVQSLHDVAFQVGSDGRILVFAEFWRLYSLSDGEPLPDVGPHNSRRKSFYSPDLKYYLSAQPEDDPDQFVLYSAADGKKLTAIAQMASVYAVAWSPDSKRFALVGLPKGVGAPHPSDQLAVYSLP
jgi:hypothetical protein